jgi:hypothetical protein
VQQRIIDKYSKIPIKLKTEVEDELDYNGYMYARPKRQRLPSVTEADAKTLRVDYQVHGHQRSTLWLI